VDTDGAEKHDLFRTHIKHIFDPGKSVVIFSKIRLIHSIDMLANGFSFIKGKTGRRNEDIYHQVAIALGKIFHFGQ